MEGIVEAVGLTKVFGKRNKHPAVAELELSIPEGQLFGLVGPDGAGKTTTIRILSTVMLPTSGSCRVQKRRARLLATCLNSSVYTRI